MNSYTCREHGGTFYVPIRRGRPPVRCTEDNLCKQPGETQPKRARALSTAHDVVDSNTRRSAMSKTARAPAPITTAERKRTSAAIRGVVTTTEKVDAVTHNMSVPLAQACKAELEALGWTAKGRGWIEEPDNPEAPSTLWMAQVTATRGSESLVITWCDGGLSRQDYSLWHGRRSLNGMPARKLKFNPDEMSDRELVRAIAGMKVTWWNTLAKAEEYYVVSGDKLSIEHFYSSNGDEDTGRRIVKFIDRNGKGYRHFHVEALIKVG